VIQLVDARPEHAEAWHGWRQQSLAVQFMPLEPATVSQLAERIMSASSDLRNRSAPRYLWFVAHDGHVIGMTGLVNVSWTMGYSEITYMIDPSHHRQGFGTQAVRAMITKVFGETDLARLFAIVSRGHTASERLLRRLGFTEEGLLRRHYAIQGERVDQLVFGLLRPEWPPASPA
jgi:ribosomal-protein-alanine N-acetyltransferase